MSIPGVIYDDDGAAKYALMARPMADAQEYMVQRMNHYLSTVGNVAAGFAEEAKRRFDMFNNQQFIDKIEHYKRKLNTIWQTNEFRSLSDISMVQEAPDIMQRWIMACPEIRTYYNTGGCSGYDGAYVDMYPGTIGGTHYDYRRVMDGVIHRQDEKIVSTEYIDSMVNVEDILTTIQKSCVISSWEVIRRHLEDSNIDPTSLQNEKLS